MENVIVVIMNFRLHVLGFLSLPSKGIYGNAGLKDQQMALEWIYENISNFNGDPNNICLFGESAGAICVQLQVLNAKSRKFIKSAILQSGTALGDLNFPGHTVETEIALAKILGCKSNAIDDVYKTLMAANVKDLYDECDKASTDGIKAAFSVIIENESDDAFVTKSSTELLISQAGQINIPMICGVVNGEGMPLVARIVANKFLDFARENLSLVVPRSLKTGSKESTDKLVADIESFYFNGKDSSDQNVKEFVSFFSDIFYGIPHTISNELTARYQPGCRQFLYEFQFVGKLNFLKQRMKMDHLPLACHADDTYYLFGGELSDKATFVKAL